MNLSMHNGEIFRCRMYAHPFVFITNIDKDQFKGIMLTHDGRHDNVPLRSEHILKKNPAGGLFSFRFDNTYFPYVCLIKNVNILDCFKIGELSECGKEYINETLKDAALRTWDEYNEQHI